MKINMFVNSLLAMIKTLAITYSLFFLLMLVFNDHLDSLGGSDEVFLYIFLGLFFNTLATTLYFFAILLPTYYIDRKNYIDSDVATLFRRHAPIVTVFIVLIAGLGMLIAGKEGMSEGLVQANFFSAFVTTYCGLLLFEIQVKSAVNRIKPPIPVVQQT